MLSRPHLLQLGAFLLFAVGVVCLWMLPVLLAGQMYDVPLLLAARNLHVSGCLVVNDELGRILAPDLLCTLGQRLPFDGRVSLLVFSWVMQWVSMSNLTGWAFVSCILVFLALLGWWCAIAQVFDKRVAWLSSILLAFMPFYWREAVWLDFYSVSYVLLAWSAAAYLLLRGRSEYLALAVAGLLYGLSVGAKDVFLIFLPWIVIAYLWVHRALPRKAVGAVVVLLFCVIAAYILPYLGDIRTVGYPVNYNLARVWPGAAELQESFYLHLYPDPYTYLFDREAFDAQLLTRYEGMSLLEKLQMQKSLISFGIGEPNVFLSLLNGAWLFVGAIPSFLQQETMGGIFLWLFILPGALLLLRERRSLFTFLVGLVISGELIIRFVFHYGRGHLMDYGWVLALFAAVGVTYVADMWGKSKRQYTTKAVSIFIVLLLSLQLMQANRVVFARRYSRTFVPQIFQIAETVRATPEESVIATGIGSTRVEQIAQMSNRTIALFDENTMHQLMDDGLFLDVMDLYAVSHVLGYSDALNTRIRTHAPALEITAVSTESSVPSVSLLQSFLLHIIR